MIPCPLSGRRVQGTLLAVHVMGCSMCNKSVRIVNGRIANHEPRPISKN